MSKLNGDKARFGKQRKAKLLKRKNSRAISHTATPLAPVKKATAAAEVKGGAE